MARTIKAKPEFSVSWNWNAPLVWMLGFFKRIGVADQRFRPGKIAIEVGKFNPDAKIEPEPSAVNFRMVPSP